MLLSPGNVKQGLASTAERRVSAPPLAQPAAFSSSPSPIKQVELPKPRPRSDSHVQFPLYSPMTSPSSLPASPLSAARTPEPYRGGVRKVPLQEEDDEADVGNADDEGSLQSSLPSPRILNSNRLYPNSHRYSPHPHSPQLIPKDFPYSSQQGHMSTTTLSSMLHSMASDSHSLDDHSTQTSNNRHLDVPGHGIGSQSYESLEEENLQPHQRTSWIERPHPANHFLQSDTISQQLSPTLSSSCPTEFSSVTELQQLNPRLHNQDVLLSSPRSSVEYNTDISSPSIHPADLQPYCPPPPSFGNPRSQTLSWQKGYSEGDPIPPPPPILAASAIPASARANIMAASKTTALNPNHGNRRHSSGTHELSVKTKHLHSVKQGPSTDDISSGTTFTTTSSKSRHLDPESSTGGSSRNHSKPRQHSPSRETSRPLPNHLDISRQQQQNRHHHHSKHQSPVLPQHKMSTLRSPGSSRTTSPGNSGFLESLQDRTAMALMQRYLLRPDALDSETDIGMQIMISQAAVDSKGFEVLTPQALERVKRVRMGSCWLKDHHVCSLKWLKLSKGERESMLTQMDA